MDAPETASWDELRKRAADRDKWITLEDSKGGVAQATIKLATGGSSNDKAYNYDPFAVVDDNSCTMLQKDFDWFDNCVVTKDCEVH